MDPFMFRRLDEPIRTEWIPLIARNAEGQSAPHTSLGPRGMTHTDAECCAATTRLIAGLADVGKGESTPSAAS